MMLNDAVAHATPIAILSDRGIVVSEAFFMSEFYYLARLSAMRFATRITGIVCNPEWKLGKNLGGERITYSSKPYSACWILDN